MNLSILERMARDGDLSYEAMRYLLNCHSECEWLDYKEELHLDTPKELSGFSKDVLAIKNVGGGYIVIGVRDKTWEPLGLSEKMPYDSKQLRDKIRSSIGVDLDVDIVHYNMPFPGSTGLFALIFVRSTRKRNKRRTPTLASNNFHPKESFGIRHGDIYVRKGDQTTKIKSQSELAELLENLEMQADEDANILSTKKSHFAIENSLYRLLEKGYEKFIGRTKLKQKLLEAVKADPRIWIINVHGPGGVGKSALVNWAVYEFYEKRDFEAILQLTAKETILTSKGIEIFGRSLYSLENLLDHILNLFQENPPTDLNDKKNLAIEYLCAWKTLLVLDNLETVQDGRILDFVQKLPLASQAKVLITSRQKTGSWELPFPVQELNLIEVDEFLKIRSNEMNINFPHGEETTKRVLEATGGLPLAIQWVLGQYRIKQDMGVLLRSVVDKDSPVLEFSFRNIWQVLSSDAKIILAIMTIFSEPPTSQQIAITTQFSIERIEIALSELSDVTLVTRNTQITDGRITYTSLPITLSFARHQLSTMGDFEKICRRRFQEFTDQMKLQSSELIKFQNKFEKYGLDNNNEKKAAILCQRGESDLFIGNAQNADLLFKQARELSPQSSYIYAMSASYELTRNRISNALNYATEACKRATKKTGALCYTIYARILYIQNDRNGRVEALKKALEYEPEDVVLRHQYGVALSQTRRTEEAIREFSIIINEENKKDIPTHQMLMALKTRMINLKRLNREIDFQNDSNLARSIINKYPHLTNEVEQFSEFLENENGT